VLGAPHNGILFRDAHRIWRVGVGKPSRRRDDWFCRQHLARSHLPVLLSFLHVISAFRTWKHLRLYAMMRNNFSTVHAPNFPEDLVSNMQGPCRPAGDPHQCLQVDICWLMSTLSFLLKRVSGKFDANLYGMHLPVAEIHKIATCWLRAKSMFRYSFLFQTCESADILFQKKTTSEVFRETFSSNLLVENTP
jgi:hypothetical protein